MKTIMRSIFCGVVLAAFLVSGCKGKEERQTSGGPPEARQGAGAGTSQTSGVPGSAVSPGDAKAPLSAPPRINSVKFSPERPVRGDKIKAEVSAISSGAGENVSIEYHWSRNDAPLSESSDTLSVDEGFKPGDKIALTVVPDDGGRKGSPASVVIFVGNSPPSIVPSEDTYKFRGREYSYKVKATDPDGDTLTYSLKAAPPGMTIDPSAGLIHWTIPADFKGSAAFTVIVSDGHGGEAMMNYTLEIPK